MRNDMSIQGVTPVAATSQQLPEPRGQRPTEPTPAPPAVPVAIYANPSLRLDPSLGLVVIEFRNSTGSVIDSIPTQRQLRAYKQYALSSAQARPTEAPQPAAGLNPTWSRGPPLAQGSAPGNRASIDRTVPDEEAIANRSAPGREQAVPDLPKEQHLTPGAS